MTNVNDESLASLSYGELLAMLRNDLQLDPATDLQTASALNLTADSSPSPIQWVAQDGGVVASLQSDATGALTLSGSALNFDGPITATQFNGVIAADGLAINAYEGTTPSTAPSTNRVTFVRTADGAVIASSYGATLDGTSKTEYLISEAKAADATEGSTSIIQATDDQAAIQAWIQAQQTQRGLTAAVSVHAGTAAATLLAKGGISTYANLGSTPMHSIAGVATLSWPGSNPTSNATHIVLPGATGTVQGVACATAAISGTSTAPVMSVQPDGAGGVNVYGQAWNVSPSAGAICSFAYLIWGS